MLAVVVTYGIRGDLASAGPYLVMFFFSMGIAIRAVDGLKGYTYTCMIFAAVALSMYYPSYFDTIGDFKLSALITPCIQLIMFGMGTSMSANDFAGVLKEPKGVLIGVVSHFLIMPLMGFLLASTSGFPDEIAAGIILIGCSPNGMASNVIAYLAKANLALSITITAVSTMLAPLVTPLLMKLLAGALVTIDTLDMMWDIFKMVIIPIGAGLLFNRLVKGKAVWIIENVMPRISMFGIVLIIVIITSAGRENLISIGGKLLLVVLAHNLFGYFFGYWTGRLFRMGERDCRTMAIEVGMQNGGLASGIAKEMGKMATVGLAPAIFGPLMNITGSILASWWHKKPIHELSGDDLDGKRDL